jgi:hypothetical protein
MKTIIQLNKKKRQRAMRSKQAKVEADPVSFDSMENVKGAQPHERL